jgi:hypothetical protein
VRYWRDKSAREIDFVIPQGEGSCLAVECKWRPEQFEPDSLRAFRAAYPHGTNWVVCPNIREPYAKRFDSLKVQFGAPTHVL